MRREPLESLPRLGRADRGKRISELGGDLAFESGFEIENRRGIDEVSQLTDRVAELWCEWQGLTDEAVARTDPGDVV